MSKTAVKYEDAALAVDCPMCLSQPGDPCFAEDGYHFVDVHASRINDLRRLITEAKEQRPRPSRPEGTRQ